MKSREVPDRSGVDVYLEAVLEKGLARDKDRLRFQLNNIYDDLDFKDRSVLDVGGGAGLHSYYAASRGAKYVVCLEPEASGGSKGALSKFQELGSALKFDNVRTEAVRFQEFNPGLNVFDIIILHDSINHLNEEACINLLHDVESKLVYQEVFLRIAGMAAEGAYLIICDCSMYNVFNWAGVVNPFNRSIDWRKHQAPETWADMLGDAGFVCPKVKWSSPNRLGRLGKALFGNRAMAYFFTSHFCLTMEKRRS